MGAAEMSEAGLKHLGFQMKIAEKRNRDAFDNLKHACPNRKKLYWNYRKKHFVCEGIKHTAHVWPCEMLNCPLLKVTP